ncbi:MAG TPA: hypothetical protein VF602_10885, partial [Pedobacter sp.]
MSPDLDLDKYAENLLIEQNDEGLTLLNKNERGDYIKVLSFAKVKYEPELDEKNQPSIHVICNIQAFQPINVVLHQHIDEATLLGLVEKLRALQPDSE